MKPKLISPPKGVYPPIITPFTPLEDLDLDALYNHVVHLIKAGCAGIVVMGSTGEAVMLTDAERIQVIKTARKAIDSVNPNAVLIAGTGTQSTIQTIKYTNDAGNAGADFAIILTPSYYASNMIPEAIESFFVDVADASIIPILIYNYPGVTSGINLNSDLISKLAHHPRIVGCKLTCGDVGKLIRIVSATQHLPNGFAVFGGFADFLLPGTMVNASGCIAGLANICPKTTVKLYNSSQSQLTQGDVWQAAIKLQEVVARADWVIIQTGVPGIKYAMQTYFGFGGILRKPLQQINATQMAMIDQNLKEVMEIEKADI